MCVCVYDPEKNDFLHPVSAIFITLSYKRVEKGENLTSPKLLMSTFYIARLEEILAFLLS